MLFETTIDLPLGTLSLYASDTGLRAVLFENHREGKIVLPKKCVRDANHPVLAQAEKELREYFSGERTNFDLPLDPWGGTPFQRTVWDSLRKIPYGVVVSYTYQADKLLGLKNAVRAVAAANSKNPLSIIVPCHRVIAASGKLQGYAGGIAIKKLLLNLEAATLIRTGSTSSPNML